MDRKFDFNDITIVPKTLSEINSRESIKSYLKNQKILVNAPMYDVINKENYKKILNSGILTITARNHNLENNDDVFSSYSLKEFKELFINTKYKIETEKKVLIDIANGHMMDLYETSKKAKEIYGDKLKLMVGNIANPETYEKYCDIGVDYVRVSIGAGSGCLTSVNTGVHYPVASLIHEIGIIKNDRISNGKFVTKVVADGGFKNYSDIIKAIALGSDNVMLGSIFSKSLESAGEKYFLKLIKVKNENIQKILMKRGLLYVRYRGMSTKSVQKEMGNEIIKTSEGTTRFFKVEYTLDGWMENFIHYLSSCMSYTGSKTIEEFQKNSKFIFITKNSFNRFNK